MSIEGICIHAGKSTSSHGTAEVDDNDKWVSSYKKPRVVKT